MTIQQPPDRDGTAYDGDDQVSPRIWRGLLWSVPIGLATSAVIIAVAYLFCDSCWEIW